VAGELTRRARCSNFSSRATSRILLTVVSALFIALLSKSAAADTPEANHVWSLDELVDELTRSNSQLEQAKQVYLAAQLQVPQANAFPAAQISLLEQASTGGPFNFNVNDGFYEYPTLTQPFLWWGKRRLAGELANAQAEVLGRQYDGLVIQLVSQLKLAFYGLAALKHQLAFMNEDLQRLDQIKQVTQVRYANNAAAYVDFLNAQVSQSSLENDRFALEKQIQQQLEQLNSLLGRPSQTPLQVRDTQTSPRLPAKSLGELIEVAQKTNPLIAGGESQIEAADKSVALAEKGFYPDFAVNVGAYEQPGLTHLGSTRLYQVGVTLNLPTWGFRKEKATLDQARVQLKSTKAGQSSNLQQVDLNVANAYHGLETSLQQIKFTRERLLPQAQMAYRLALTGYSSNGGTAFSDLLTAQSSLRSTELALIRAENAAVQAYISLAAAIGRDPD
jgi:cobalt-zinc-cadmium efflux system outer membrane protein